YRACVFPEFIPTFGIAESEFGAAAAGIDWAQRNLPDHFGYDGHPLSRNPDPNTARLNRNKICDNSFVPDPTIPMDSCDEWPFASSYESGAQLGQVGSQCAEIKPLPAPGWPVALVKPLTGAERCSRAHVPEGVNEGVGGALAGFNSEFHI